METPGTPAGAGCLRAEPAKWHVAPTLGLAGRHRQTGEKQFLGTRAPRKGPGGAGAEHLVGFYEGTQRPPWMMSRRSWGSSVRAVPDGEGTSETGPGSCDARAKLLGRTEMSL